MKQSEVFAKGEGDAWFARNAESMEIPYDPVIEMLSTYVKNPKYVYEVGCANGWRLSRIYDCKTGGIDPSSAAIAEAISSGIRNVYCGDAINLINAEGCDVLIYGFCLYLCDPEDYFKIVCEGNRVLKDGGYLIIHDFDAADGIPRRVPYEHKEGVFSHHVEFALLWKGHPWYRVLEVWYEDDQSFTILKKDSKEAWK